MRAALDICPLDRERARMGRGKGVGKDYIPWIKIGEFLGLGEERYVPGRKIPRRHTTLSQIERAFLEWAETRGDVRDIMEQYPLDIETTFQIAHDLVVLHPRDFETKGDKVMSVDFLLSTGEGLEACSIKNTKDLLKTRTLQKLEIEQEYWRRKGVPWRLFTEKEAGPLGKKNCRWLSEHILFHGETVPLEIKQNIRKVAEQLWETPMTVETLASEIDLLLNLDTKSIHIIKELVRERAWDFNSYHGDLSRDLFQMEEHWTGEKVLRAQTPLAGFESDHMGSDIHRVRLAGDTQRNEKLKKTRRENSAARRTSRPETPKKKKSTTKTERKPWALPGMPRPYRDELIFSVLCRLHKKMKRPPISVFSNLLWARPSGNPGTTVGNYLEEISAKFPQSWGVTAQSLRRDHTLAGFVLDWVAWSGKTKYTMVDTLKSCPECRVEDKKKLGESYWRRMHQIEGSTRCYWHGCPLERSRAASLAQSGSRAWVPNYFGPDDAEWESIPAGDWGTERLALKMIWEVLRGRTVGWDIQQKSLLGEMERQGFTRGLHIDGWKVLEVGKERFGGSLESLFHISSDARGRRVVSDTLNGDAPDAHRILFFHCFLRLGVGEEAAPAVLEALDRRESRKGIPEEKRDRRRRFFEKIRGLGLEDIRVVSKEMEDDAKWVEGLIAYRARRHEKTRTRREASDWKMAQLVSAVAKNISKANQLERVTLEKIVRAAGKDGAGIRRCVDEPLTKSVLTAVVDSDEGVVRRRIEWGKSRNFVSYYDFITQSKLRGIQLPLWAETEIIESVNAKREAEEAVDEAQDRADAEQIRDAAKRLRTVAGRPPWIRKTAILREAGLKKLGPVADRAAQEESDTRETLLAKRVAWAKKVLPIGKKLNRYELRDFMGMRGWRETPRELDFIRCLMERDWTTSPAPA
jgi:hypothetical protein